MESADKYSQYVHKQMSLTATEIIQVETTDSALLSSKYISSMICYNEVPAVVTVTGADKPCHIHIDYWT